MGVDSMVEDCDVGRKVEDGGVGSVEHWNGRVDEGMCPDDRVCCQGNNSGILFFIFLPLTKCLLHILLCTLTCETLHKPIKAIKLLLFLGKVKNLIFLQLDLLERLLQPGTTQECTISREENQY